MLINKYIPKNDFKSYFQASVLILFHGCYTLVSGVYVGGNTGFGHGILSRRRVKLDGERGTGGLGTCSIDWDCCNGKERT